MGARWADPEEGGARGCKLGLGPQGCAGVRPIVPLSFQLPAHSVVAGVVFRLWKLANAITWGFFCFIELVYQHITGSGSLVGLVEGEVMF